MLGQVVNNGNESTGGNAAEGCSQFCQ